MKAYFLWNYNLEQTFYSTEIQEGSRNGNIESLAEKANKRHRGRRATPQRHRPGIHALGLNFCTTAENNGVYGQHGATPEQRLQEVNIQICSEEDI